MLAAFSLAVAGFYGMKAAFWATPSVFLSGPALAAGLAFINSIGNFCGYLGPIVVGYAKDATGSFEAGIYVLAAAAAVSTVTALGCALVDATHGGARGGVRRCAGPLTGRSVAAPVGANWPARGPAMAEGRGPCRPRGTGGREWPAWMAGMDGRHGGPTMTERRCVDRHAWRGV